VNSVQNCPFSIPIGHSHCTTSQKVADSIPDEVVAFFNLNKPSSGILALESNQLLTEMNTRNLPGVKGGRRVRPNTSSPSMR
jgi:hypothetical protein